MATKKNTKKKSTKAGKKDRKKATGKKAVRPSKKLARSKPAPKHAKKKKSPSKNKKPSPKKSAGPRGHAFLLDVPRSGEQSGDLQGLSSRESADSESVDELVEEGNAYEADVVAGVERADDADEKEVRTHEVPEDDVPGEYLDDE